MSNIIINDIDKLRIKSEPIIDFDREYLNIIQNDLLKELRRWDIGYAISAPQIGVYKNIILVDIKNPDVVTGNNIASTPMFLINPQIKKVSKETNVILESCLSFPDVEKYIKRPAKIKIKYNDIQGNSKSLALNGLEARCVLHEYDHLTGKLIIDYESVSIEAE